MTLNLQKLVCSSGSVNILSSKMMNAVTSLCPLLKAINFVEKEINDSSGDSIVLNEELQSILTNNFKEVIHLNI